MLALVPHFREEDEILIQECQVGPRNWRKMILQLPRRNACQIRVRYHILQEWQTLTNSNLVRFEPLVFLSIRLANERSVFACSG